MATLIHHRKFPLDKTSHLKDAEHIFLLVKKSEVVRQELDLERVRELLDHLKVEEVKELREEAVLGLINVNLVDVPVSFLFCSFLFHRELLAL